MTDQISVLIVDDSALMRKFLRILIEKDSRLTLADVASNGLFALEKIRKNKPDIVLLDLEMPEMNGIDFLKQRAKEKIDVPVIVVSSLSRKAAPAVMESLALGASDFIQKPSGLSTTDLVELGHRLRTLIKFYARGWKEVDSSPPEDATAPPSKQLAPEPPSATQPYYSSGSIELIVIGISTGGPGALRALFLSLRRGGRVPILIVQHMPPGFTKPLAENLDKIAPLRVCEAKEGDSIMSGQALIAPAGRHMRIVQRGAKSVIEIDETPPVNGHRPSVDVLLETASEIYKDRLAAIIMTGMGRDGAAMMEKVHRNGGFTIAQDVTSCVVFGMPRVAIEKRCINKICSLTQIGKELNFLLEGQVAAF